MKDVVMLMIGCGTVILLAGAALLAMPQSKLRDFLMPIVAWCFALLCGLYVCSPLDIVPDVVPVAGWVDDAGAIVAGISAIKTALNAKKSRDKHAA